MSDQTAVNIPGTVTAFLNDNGSVDRIEFFPHGSAAGYRGPAFEVIVGDEEAVTEESLFPALRDYVAEKRSREIASDEAVVDWVE